ncbi:unnamed protein product [Aureobasidium vineae]|uniref:Uncharacterized protein n=1 Tax=Aureobasidium vineae TaxID=2773715 RepID=A0A9N8JS17_9PEZI|nr:unnamed protein product [Aureobasidium vineae]
MFARLRALESASPLAACRIFHVTQHLTFDLLAKTQLKLAHRASVLNPPSTTGPQRTTHPTSIGPPPNNGKRTTRSMGTPRPTASRTPQQPRSSNASPAPTAPAVKPAPAAPAPAAPAGNVWAQRAAAQKPAAAAAPKAAKKEQSAAAGVQEVHVSVNNFNEGEVKQMLAKGEVGSVYKPDYSGGASKLLTTMTAACMANGKNFWAHLEEQVAAARKKEGQ